MHNETIGVDKNFNLNFASMFKVKCGHDKRKKTTNQTPQTFLQVGTAQENPDPDTTKMGTVQVIHRFIAFKVTSAADFPSKQQCYAQSKYVLLRERAFWSEWAPVMSVAAAESRLLCLGDRTVRYTTYWNRELLFPVPAGGRWDLAKCGISHFCYSNKLSNHH